MKGLKTFVATVLLTVAGIILLAVFVSMAKDGQVTSNNVTETRQDTRTLQQKIDDVNRRWGVPPLNTP